MKKTLLTIALLATFTLTGLAQQTDAPPKNNPVSATDTPVKKAHKELTPDQAAQRQSTKAAEELGLNAEQKQKFYDASLIRINANRPLKQQAQATTDKAAKKKLHQQMKANRDTFDKSVNAMLSPEQKPKWEAQKAQNKAGKEGEDHNQD